MAVMYSCAFSTTEDVPCAPLCLEGIFLFMYYALFSLFQPLLALISVTQGEKREHSDKQIQPKQKALFWRGTESECIEMPDTTVECIIYVH